MTFKPAEVCLFKVFFILPLEIKAGLWWTDNCVLLRQKQMDNAHKAQDGYVFTG